MKYLLSSDNSGDIISVINSCWVQLVYPDGVHVPLIVHKDDVTASMDPVHMTAMIDLLDIQHRDLQKRKDFGVPSRFD